MPHHRRTTTATAILLLTAGALAAAPGSPARAATPSRCGDVATRPWCDSTKTPDARAALLLAAMTQDEEVQLLGGNVRGEAPHTGAAYAIDRLGIPAVYYSDGPVGPRQGSATAMPVPIALASTFDTTLAREHGATIATEAKAKGNDVVFAPTVNILRNPQGGRSYEAYGEETFLTAETAVGWIDGAQSTGVLANVKHFAANNQEGQTGAPPITSVQGSRNLVNANVDERTLREVYFPHFEAAVKQADVATIMCSYNMVNGAYSCQNAHDTQDVLQRTWGFKGIVLSDYGAAHDTTQSLNNGLDFEPSGPGLTLDAYNPQQIDAALATGQVTKATLDAHVLRILRTYFAYGIFDRAAYANDDTEIDKVTDAATAEHIEESAITLLKNSGGVLPLSPSVRSIAVIGPYADQFVTGGGSGAVTPFAVTTALAGIKARVGPGVTVTYTDGSDQAAAAAAAKAADVAVVVVGDVETEGQDKSCISLNCSSDTANSESVLITENTSCGARTCPLNGMDEDGLVSAVAAANPKTVAVLETGAPVLTPWRDSVAAVVEAWYPGEQGGTALARMLFGDTDPGGRLPATFPASADQLPTAGDTSSYPGDATEQETYKEGLLVGYRWYDSHNLTPAYPFGDGLSYTSFRYSDLKLTAGTPASQDVATASVTVTNTGSRTGTAVPQLYLSKPSTSALPQPVRQLEGYATLSLAPGATATVSMPLNDRSFASWDVASSSWVLPGGCTTVEVGTSSRDLPLTGTIGRNAGCARPDLALDGPSDFTLPLPAAARVTRAKPTTTTTPAAPVTKGTPTTAKHKKTTRPTVTRATAPSRSLAATGWVVPPATVIVLVGGLLLVRRRRTARR